MERSESCNMLSMARTSNNVQNISNQDLFLLKKLGKATTDVTITIKDKKYDLTGNVEVMVTEAGTLTYFALPSVYYIFDDLQLVEESKLAPAIKSLKYPNGRKKSRGSVELPAELLAQLEEFNRANNARIRAVCPIIE